MSGALAAALAMLDGSPAPVTVAPNRRCERCDYRHDPGARCPRPAAPVSTPATRVVRTKARKPAARRAPAAGKLDPTTFRTFVDDSGVTLQYATGTAKLYGPRDTATAAADFAARLQALPGDVATAGAKRLNDGPPMEIRVPPTVDAGKRRFLQASDLHRYATSSEASCTRVLGQTLGEHWAMRQTNGHAALLTPVSGPGDPIRLHTGPEAPLRFVTTPDFWRAYSRVRTCRHEKSGAITITVGPAGVTVRAAQGDDWAAGETVPNAGTAPDAYTIILADSYVWPLRGAFSEFRQFTPNDPVFVAGLHECAVVIMPMRI